MDLALAVHRGSEDCLTVDVVVPPGGGLGLPVMQYIYGGAWIVGDKYQLGEYDEASLAKRHNVILVIANYRVDVFGFLALEELGEEDPNHSTGNLGLLDQRAALRWTQRNIGAFGGDPKKVAIFGASAGGFSVCSHLVSPMSRGLFSAAIMTSGGCDSPIAGLFYADRNRSTAFGDLYVASIGCGMAPGPGRLACLRGKSTGELMKSLPGMELGRNWNWPYPKDHPLTPAQRAVLPPLAPVMPWGMTIDGSPAGLPALPLTMLQHGDFAKVPFMAGTNRDEGTIFTAQVAHAVPNVSLPINPLGLHRILVHVWPTPRTAESILQQYPEDVYCQAGHPGNSCSDQRLAAIITDAMFACGTRRSTQAMSRQGSSSYLYHFSQRLSPAKGYAAKGDYHGSEVPFVFGHVPNATGASTTASEERGELSLPGEEFALSFDIGEWWTSMARHGSPNGGGQALGSLPRWIPYTEEGDASMELRYPEAIVAPNPKKAVCGFWDDLLLSNARRRVPIARWPNQARVL